MIIGRTFIIIGILLIAIGFLLLAAPKLFNWFGHLPGDIRVERENMRLFIPVGSMIVISLVLTLLFNAIGWILSFISRMR